MNVSTIEEFIGHSPVPVYSGQEYTDKLRLQVTFIKDPCFRDLYFSEKDCRSLLRAMTGHKSYQWLKLIQQEPDEDLWYKAKVNSVSYKRISGHITGIILNMECDSCFAWSKEFNITINAKAGQHFYVFNNTDDLNNYVYPIVSILSRSASDISITNISDNWITKIKNVVVNEKITIDSQHQIISSSFSHDSLLNDFNLGWFRLIPDRNEYISSSDATILIKFRVPRKVGIVE